MQDLYYFSNDGDVMNFTIFTSNANLVGDSLYVYSSNDGSNWFPVYEGNQRLIIPIVPDRFITANAPNVFAYWRVVGGALNETVYGGIGLTEVL